MDLTAEQFAALVTSLKMETRFAGEHNRRAPRVGVSAQILITIYGGDGPSQMPGSPATRLRAKLSNISSRGIALTYSERLENGRQFIIHMPTQAKPDVHILCTVVYCVENSASDFVIGAEFTCALSPAEVQRAMNEPAMHTRIQQSMLR